MTNESPLLAGPPGDCCLQSVKHTGTPVGNIINFANVETYISEPPQGILLPGSKKKVILYLADVYGPFYVNAKLLQDYFASHGSLMKIYCCPFDPFLTPICQQATSFLESTISSETLFSSTWTTPISTEMPGLRNRERKLAMHFRNGSKQSAKHMVRILSTVPLVSLICGSRAFFCALSK
jgi:hypothetical protein